MNEYSDEPEPMSREWRAGDVGVALTELNFSGHRLVRGRVYRVVDVQTKTSTGQQRVRLHDDPAVYWSCGALARLEAGDDPEFLAVMAALLEAA